MVVTSNREFERRNEWLADCMRRAQRRLGFTRRGQMADELGLGRTTYCNRLANPSAMSLQELWRLETVLRHAGMTSEADTIRGGFQC